MCLMFDGSPWIRCLHCCQCNIITSTIFIEGFTDIEHDWLSVAKRPPADMWCIFRKYQLQQYLFTAHTWGRSGTTRGKIHDWRWATMCVAIWKQSSIDTNIVYEYHFYVHMMKGTNRQRLGIALTRNCKSRKDR